MDEVKRMIAQAVQHHLVTNPADRPKLPKQLEHVIETKGYAISELETQIRVKTVSGMPRYFMVKVSEMC